MASNAPRFQWKRDPAGRVALVAVLCIAYYLDYTDDTVIFQGKLPSKEDLEINFMKVLPWFPGYYDDSRTQRAVQVGFQGKLDPFNIGDLQDRLAYMFHHKAISDEHPKSTEQAKPGKLRHTWIAISERVLEHVRIGKEISQEEAMAWGKQL